MAASDFFELAALELGEEAVEEEPFLVVQLAVLEEDVVELVDLVLGDLAVFLDPGDQRLELVHLPTSSARGVSPAISGFGT